MNFVVKHPVVLAFAILIIVLVGFTTKTYLDNKNQTGNRFGGGETVVVTEKVGYRAITDEVESLGTAMANESVSVTAKVTETVTKVNFEDGMLVEKGDILVELTNSEETAMLAEAQASVEEATRQFNRVKNLIDQKLASETQLDVERARMQTAEARLNGIVARLDDRLIRAPFSGQLGFRNVSNGTLLTPTTPITTLDDVSIIKLDFSIPESYLSTISEGQEVIAVSSAYASTPFIGRVATVNSRIDPITRSVKVRAVIENKDHLLRPGMLLTVKLIQETQNVLAVPEEAVIPVQQDEFVYVVEEGVAVRKVIKTGRRMPGIVEVLEGLSEGEEVITQGIIKIRPGSKVVVKTS